MKKHELDKSPFTILLFRHAEKPANGADPHLSAAGYSRAARLAQYLPATFGKPDFIIAAALSKQSQRPYETVQPLSQATGLKIDATIKETDFKKLAKSLLKQKQYAGKLVVVCWHHGTIPDLAGCLNAPSGTYPQPWDPKVFNLIIKLDYTPGNLVPAVTLVTEPF